MQKREPNYLNLFFLVERVERRWPETIPRILKREITPSEDIPDKNIEDDYEVIISTISFPGLPLTIEV